MSELNTATMDREELEAAATDLGISFQGNTKDDTLRKKIDDALGTPSSDAPIGSHPVEHPAAPGEENKAKRFRIIIATSDSDKQPVQVGVNGRMYAIKRGEEVVVPASVVNVLRDAVQHIYDPKTMKESKVLAYPFQVMGEV
ncbi:hypothetical protein TW86_18095 [Halomonas sp. S2151]|uniref:hypothetical protein n=1 Tax=unclassified Halomonas TaxID=2609666 RepID=UPI0005FA0970|nr:MULTISPECIES: hypothetical protein [unclassified Halomonas]KJZ07168.1 hypothetical protein TW86_18095 [Halomonas sp. S2151]MBY6109076.1 hypothetical protein [Halomonas sp. DP1Y21-3]